MAPAVPAAVAPLARQAPGPRHQLLRLQLPVVAVQLAELGWRLLLASYGEPNQSLTKSMLMPLLRRVFPDHYEYCLLTSFMRHSGILAS